MTDTEISLSQRLDVEGTANLRELGGYAAGGTTVRWGKLFRSDALHALTALGRQSIADLGIGLVVDLRRDEETVEDPTVLPGVKIVRAPIFAAGQPSGIADRPFSLDAVYDAMVDDHGPQLVAAVTHIARSGRTPVLVHCTAGKDRTGLVVALTLLAAGVHRDDVAADFALTETNLAGPWVDVMLARMTEAGHPADERLRALVATSPPALLDRIVDRWEAEWGSPLDYLKAHGFTDRDHAALTASLLDQQPRHATPNS